MPGYVLVEQKNLSPPHLEGSGVKRNTRKIGFIDFLREIEQDEFPFDENSSLLITGIEEVLLASRPKMEETARIIRKKLQSAGGYFNDRGCGDVQIVFRGDLLRGEHLIDNHVTEKIPIYLIFGSPTPIEVNGQKIFRTTFNMVGN